MEFFFPVFTITIERNLGKSLGGERERGERGGWQAQDKAKIVLSIIIWLGC